MIDMKHAGLSGTIQNPLLNDDISRIYGGRYDHGIRENMILSGVRSSEATTLTIVTEAVLCESIAIV